MGATTRQRFKVLGITDERETCDCCGKRGLKRVVALGPLDGAGNWDGETVYYGTTCAARALEISGTKPAKERRLLQLAQEERTKECLRIFAEECVLIQAFNVYILKETRLSEIAGNMRQRVMEAVRIRNERFPVLTQR